MILIELTAAIDDAGTLQTFYFSDAAFATEPTDMPADTAFEPALIDPGFLGIHAFGDGRTGGGSKLETGEIVIANIDGQFDGLLAHSFEGRPVVIRSGDGGVYPDDFTTVLKCTVAAVQADFAKIIVRLKDYQHLLSVPFNSERYLGNNALPNGFEGTSNDLKGKVKPTVLGRVYNIAPPVVNTSKLTYQVSNGAVSSIDAVYDRGAALVNAGDYATGAQLHGATLSAGYFATCLAEGYFRLGGSPSGQVTADVTQGASAADRTAGQLLKACALAAGVDAGSINEADVIALDDANSATVGIFIQDETFAAVMDAIAASVGAYYGFDPLGVFHMGRLAEPDAALSVGTLQAFDVLAIERRVLRDNGVPVWSATVDHSRNNAVQSSDLAGSVTDERRAFLALQQRSETAADASVKNKYLLAGEMKTGGLLTDATSAGLEASRNLALYKVRRDLYDVTVDLSFVTDNELALMNVVTLQYSRFGLDAGEPFALLGLRVELAKKRAILSLWG